MLISSICCMCVGGGGVVTSSTEVGSSSVEEPNDIMFSLEVEPRPCSKAAPFFLGFFSFVCASPLLPD